ncbi:MAG TPA: hypothetical protein VGO80_06075 [Solirubrobacteraceae bacterium]|jgi:hypothetical protein|nr:hypothetical protein [Solirubrobacteraceae bacterium]
MGVRIRCSRSDGFRGTCTCRGAGAQKETNARAGLSRLGGPLRTLAHALRHGPVRNTAVHYRVKLPDESFTGTFIVHGLPGAEGLGDGERFGPQFVPDDLGVPALGGQNGREVRHELLGLTVADGGLTPTRRRATTTMTLADLAGELADLADRYATEDFDALEDLHGPAVYDADGAIVVHRTIEDRCDACDEIHVVDIVGPYGGCLAFCRDTEACRRRQAAQKRFTDSVDDEIRSIDDRVYARRAAAYSSDEYGDVANTDAPADLRELMARLAVLMLGRDGQWPTWWRTPGQPPDSDRHLYEEARGPRTTSP